MQPRINNHDVVELIGQVIFRSCAQVVYHLANSPELWSHDNFSLHQATGRVFGVAERLLYRRAVCIFQSVQNGFLLVILKIFDQINDVVAVHITNGLRQNMWLQDRNNFLADAVVEFR